MRGKTPKGRFKMRCGSGAWPVPLLLAQYLHQGSTKFVMLRRRRPILLTLCLG